MESDPDAPAVAALADVIETVVRAALAPVVGRLRALETAPLPDPPAPGPPGPMGPVGPPGADGLGWDDYTVEYDGERTITHRWARGDTRIAQAITLPTPIYRGVHVPGKAYARGDLVTAGGSMWHCNTDTTTPPGMGSPAWSLAVKHGRDAK